MNLWPWQAKPKGLEDRTNALRSGAARLAIGEYASPRAMEDDLSFLIAIKEDNKNIADMTKTAGWVEYEAALVALATKKLRELPRKIREKDASAEWDAALVDIINTVLLGLVTNAIYESANMDRLINSKLTAKARLEENRNV